ncbi:hypothetical protein ACH5RR_034309 [Cinchona calisaya]|uniref:Myb-like domain-containing protein n=1 Tax=Cinchona calisaya TaxID=153742 RepID=A0ABD2YFZ4_9GENT
MVWAPRIDYADGQAKTFVPLDPHVLTVIELKKLFNEVDPYIKAKRKEKDAMQGVDMEQYHKIWDYAASVRRDNPGNTVKVKSYGSHKLNGVDKEKADAKDPVATIQKDTYIKVEEHLNECNRRETYLKAYAHMINPVPATIAKQLQTSPVEPSKLVGKTDLDELLLLNAIREVHFDGIMLPSAINIGNTASSSCAKLQKQKLVIDPRGQAQVQTQTHHQNKHLLLSPFLPNLSIMLGTSSASAGGLIGNSADASVAVAGATVTADSGASGEGAGAGTIPSGFSEDDKVRIEEGERVGGGHRWPRQETLALLKIRSEMDVTFKDASLKGPLWEDVSRKMAELGYQRSSKKCKEKFENVFKYHKRTKEGRTSKTDGKTYRFFDQLEALESNHPLQSPPSQRPQPPMAASAATMAVPESSNPTIPSHGTVSSAPLSPNPVSFAQNFVTQVPSVSKNPPIPTIPSSLQPPPQSHQLPMPPTTNVTHIPPPPPPPSNTYPGMLSNSSSSSTSSDEEIGRRSMRKRKWKDFFERLMKNVIDKQEELQKKFLETLEKREHDRMIREEAWRVQEMARMNREHDLLVQERSMAAAKDTAVIAFLQKVTQQNPNSTNTALQIPVQFQLPENPLPPPPPPLSSVPPSISVSIPQATPIPLPSPAPAPTPAPAPAPTRNVNSSPKTDNGVQNSIQPSSSRWPKAEVEALIRLRTNLDVKYQENGPKGPLWEEISSGMRKLGYNRNSKRCKEKWENINKYFKKVKESNKKRMEDSKTCPYFYQLDALYKEKGKGDTTRSFNPAYGNAIKPEKAMAPIMARPEQQWPSQQNQQPQPQQQHFQHRQDMGMEDRDHESDNMDENDHDDDDGDEDEEEDDEGGGYQIVTNKQPSSVATTVE